MLVLGALLAVAAATQIIPAGPLSAVAFTMTGVCLLAIAAYNAATPDGFSRSCYFVAALLYIIYLPYMAQTMQPHIQAGHSSYTWLLSLAFFGLLPLAIPLLPLLSRWQYAGRAYAWARRR